MYRHTESTGNESNQTTDRTTGVPTPRPGPDDPPDVARAISFDNSIERPGACLNPQQRRAAFDTLVALVLTDRQRHIDRVLERASR